MWFGVRSKWHLIRDIRSWSDEPDKAGKAPHMWDVVARTPLELVLRTGLVVGLTGVPFLAIAALFISDQPWWAFFPIAMAISTAGLASAVMTTFGGELLLRPMMEDIATYLPANFAPRELTWRLRGRLLVPLPAVALLGPLTAAAFIDLVDPGPERLALALGLALVLVAALALILRVVTRSALDPLDDLLEATQKVAAGDLNAHVPVVTSDDLGHVAVSFNRMVADLRERTAELRASRARIVAAGNEERRRVERDLHDGAQQALVLAQLKVGLLSRRLEHDPARAAALAQEVSDDLTRALAELRELARGIYPSVLETDGLPGALRDAADRAALPVTVHANGTGRLPRDIETAVYFCCLEALQNAAKHAGEGAKVAIELVHDGHELRFVVDDDGRGFEPSTINGSGSGLQSLADRLGAVGGVLTIDSAPGRGTRIAGTVPDR
jgi:signal transduction histidine kinase